METNRHPMLDAAGCYTGLLTHDAGILLTTAKNEDGHRYEVAHLGAQHATAGELPGLSEYAVAEELARRWNAVQTLAQLAAALTIELKAEAERSSNLQAALKHLVCTIEDLGAVDGRAHVSVKGAAVRRAKDALQGVQVTK